MKSASFKALAASAAAVSLFVLPSAVRAGNDLNLALVEAARTGVPGPVKALLDQKADPNAKAGGNTALMEAVANQHPEAVRLLLERGADPNIQNDMGNTALITAVYNKDLETMNYLLFWGADLHRTPNAKGPVPLRQDALGQTALMQAVDLGFADAVDLLLTYNVDPNQKDGYGNVPLIEASTGDHAPIVALLLKRGADVHEKDMGGDSALSMARGGWLPPDIAGMIESAADKPGRVSGVMGSLKSLSRN